MPYPIKPGPSADVSVPVLLATSQAAAILGLAPGTLANMRSRGESPIPYVKIGSAVRYRSEDIARYIENSLVAA